MTLYCVKLADNTNYPDEIVGIYSVRSLRELWWFVDEVCNPHETVYAPLPSGGFCWPSRGPKVADIYLFPDDESGECAATIFDGEPEITESLQFAFSDGLKFKPMPDIDLFEE